MAKKKTTKLINDSSEDIDIDVNFHFSPELVTAYVNEVAVQTIQTSFVLSFFEFRVPLSENKEASKPVLDAVCVGRVALSMEKIPGIIEALQSAYDELAEERGIDKNANIQEK